MAKHATPSNPLKVIITLGSFFSNGEIFLKFWWVIVDSVYFTNVRKIYGHHTIFGHRALWTWAYIFAVSTK